MVTATLMHRLDGWRGDARLYSLSNGDFIIISAVTIQFLGSAPETLIFPATADGDVIDFHRLTGSFAGAIDHERALQDHLESLNAELFTFTFTRYETFSVTTSDGAKALRLLERNPDDYCTSGTGYCVEDVCPATA